ncbi:hypothetical protein ACKWTF_014951 [Chironomus riparius]
MEQQSVHESLTFGISDVKAALLDVGSNVVVEIRLEFLNFPNLTLKYEHPENFEVFNSFSNFVSESKASSLENSGSLHLPFRFFITLSESLLVMPYESIQGTLWNHK